MRTVTFGVANSLDNFIARPDGGVDWLRWSKDAGAIMTDYWKGIDTILMGRKTYEVAKAKYKGGRGGYPDIKTYIFSRTLKGDPGAGAEIIASDAAAFVRKLKRKKGKDICVMGGGELARSLFEAGVIDEIGFNIHPVLLGSGVPLFLPMRRQVNLELLECRPIDGGCVFVRYRVKK
jgi:dihydrofolate reductase